jgi:glycosyltransferase 2 family protein
MDHAAHPADSGETVRAVEVLMTEDASNAGMSMSATFERRLRQAVLIAAIAVLGYLGLAIIGDASVVIDGLGRLNPWQWFTLLGLSLLNYALRFVRWHMYLLALGARVSWWRDLWIYLAGFAFTVSPGKAGEAVRSVYLRENGIPWSQSLATLTLERVLDLIAMVMLAALAIQVFADYAWAALVVVVLIGASLFGMTHPRMVRWLLAWLPTTGRVGKLAQGGAAILNDSRSLLAPARLIAGLTLGLIAWAAEALGFWFLLDWLGVGSDPLHAIGIYAVSMLAGALSFLPGGIGGAEAAMVTLILASGAVLSTAVVATVICRATTLWFAVVIGIGTLLVMGRR